MGSLGPAESLEAASSLISGASQFASKWNTYYNTPSVGPGMGGSPSVGGLY